MKQLVIGGVRSGKSQYAEKITGELARHNLDPFLTESLVTGDNKENIVYLATAQVLDESMKERVRRHEERRPSHWRVIEEPLSIADVLLAVENQNATILVECMTLWLTNLLLLEEQEQEQDQENAASVTHHKTSFFAALATTKSNVVIVTSEVGEGVMPMNALARRYADEMGELNQQLAALCDKVTLVTAGLPLVLK